MRRSSAAARSAAPARSFALLPAFLAGVAGGATVVALRRLARRRTAAPARALEAPAAGPDAVVLPFTRPVVTAPAVPPAPVTAPEPARPAEPARCGDSGGRTKAGAPCGARAAAGARCRHHQLAA